MSFSASHPWTWVAGREAGHPRRRRRHGASDIDHLHKQLYHSIAATGNWDPALIGDSFQHGAVFNFDFAKDGALLVAACERKSLLLFDPLSHKHITSIHNAHSDCINFVRFLDTRVFATCSDDTQVALWDVRNLKSRMRTLEGHSNWVKNIEYAQDKGLLVTSGFDGSIYAWNINSYSEDESTSFHRVFHMTGLMRMQLTPDADKLVVATASGYLMVIHDLDLLSVGKDLHGFKPNMYRLMQLSHTPMRLGYAFNHLFNKRRKRNRIELISDFPTGNDAEVIASLQIHPGGRYALSRNTSSDDNSEWTCVHRIMSKEDDADQQQDRCQNCGRRFFEEDPIPNFIESSVLLNDSDAAVERESVEEETIVPLASPSRLSLASVRSRGLSSSSSSTLSASSLDVEGRDRSPLIHAGDQTAPSNSSTTLPHASPPPRARRRPLSSSISADDAIPGEDEPMDVTPSSIIGPRFGASSSFDAIRPYHSDDDDEGSDVSRFLRPPSILPTSSSSSSLSTADTTLAGDGHRTVPVLQMSPFSIIASSSPSSPFVLGSSSSSSSPPLSHPPSSTVDPPARNDVASADVETTTNDSTDDADVREALLMLMSDVDRATTAPASTRIPTSRPLVSSLSSSSLSSSSARTTAVETTRRSSTGSRRAVRPPRYIRRSNGQLSSVRRNRASQSIDPPPRSSSSAISAATQLNSSLSNLLQSANTHRQNSTTRRGSGRRESSSTSTSSSVVEGQSSPSSRQNPPNVRRSERRNSSQRESDRERSGSANPIDADESSQSGATEASQSALNRRLAITRRGESSPPNYATISTRVGPGLRAVTYVYPRVDDPYDPLMPTRLSGDQPSSLCTCIDTTPGSGNGNEGNGAVAAHDASQKLIHANAPRLAFYEEESNMGKGFIKELCFSSDGRLVCSPFGYGVRLMAFNESCSDLSDVTSGVAACNSSTAGAAAVGVSTWGPEIARPLRGVSTIASHNNTVVCTKWSPTHCLFASACLNGKVVFYHPVL